MTASSLAAPAAWQTAVRDLWTHRIHREFCLYTNIGLNLSGAVLEGHDPEGMHYIPAYGYAQMCWHIGSLMGSLTTISEEHNVPLKQVLAEASEYAREQHGEHHPQLKQAAK